MSERFRCSEAEWRARLSPGRFRVLRGRATERPYTGAYWDCRAAGTYRCGGCEAPLFDSREKCEAQSGWPSFMAPVSEESVELLLAQSFGRVRTEVACAACGSHLGYQLYESTHPAGVKFRINSAALKLERRTEEAIHPGEYESPEPEKPARGSEPEPIGIPF